MSIYNAIAEGYVHRRVRGWSIVRVVRGRYVLDLGSGTCIQGVEVYKLGNATYVLCLDISTEMLRLGRHKYYNTYLLDFIAADAAYLPIKSRGLDAIVSIALLHHIEPRVLDKVIKEIARVLRDFGLILITTWYPWQTRFAKHLIINYILKMLIPKVFPRKVLVPWRRRNIKILRTYYLYTLKELELMLGRRFKILVKCLYSPFKKWRTSNLNNALIAIKVRPGTSSCMEN